MGSSRRRPDLVTPAKREHKSAVATRRGDDGTTGLLYGGRIRKDAPIMQVTGTVDEAQAAMGLARAEAEPGSELDVTLTALERELYVLMAEVTTDPASRRRRRAMPREPPKRPTPINVIFFQCTRRVSGFSLPDSSRELPPGSLKYC